MSEMNNNNCQSAQRLWELSNDVIYVGSGDEIYKYDREEQVQLQLTKPWEKDPHYFKHIKISALALLKMVMHARSGGSMEIMGLLQGKVGGPNKNVLIVMDCFGIPVEGTETRVNAQAEAYEYMVAYMESATKVGRQETMIGWYHSHPGYGCWLSGIDVSTENLNQSYQEPFVAIVIDPVRTISSGKVNIGAFRTYPDNCIHPNEEPSEYQSIPQDKIEDFGVHSKQYYALDISYFKSSLDKKLIDSLWNKFWINTLSSSPLIASKKHLFQQTMDLSKKLEVSHSTLSLIASPFGSEPPQNPQELKMEDKLDQIVRDSCKLATEALNSLVNQVMKDQLFNHNPHKNSK
ncbi:COP9 signalosome complex subunit 5, partial [Halocaridina rubra]